MTNHDKLKECVLIERNIERLKSDIHSYKQRHAHLYTEEVRQLRARLSNFELIILCDHSG